MKYKENWEETQQRFKAWWNRDKMDRPILNVIAKRKEPLEALEPVQPSTNPRDHHLNVEQKVKELRNTCRTHVFMAEAFPYLNINIGPGSMATYLGSEPNFAYDTVWFTESIYDKNQYKTLKFNPENYWWKHHLEQITKACQLSCNDFLIAIPDIVENIDILSNLRGPQNLCYDLIDEPDLIKSFINQIDQLYFIYYDSMYNTVKLEDGSSCYTAFSIWGPGKTAKVQCDFSALMSPSQFREFVLASLQIQCRQLSNSLYHLDGPDAIKHLDALMEINELNALQWTAGAGKPDGSSEQWYPIYEKVRNAGKSLWISLSDGKLEDWIKGADKIVKAFGNQGLYFHFPIMEEEDAKRLIATAEDYWS
jgi:5-methyltetrahydrofolate--homocysteine methyltransferase